MKQMRFLFWWFAVMGMNASGAVFTVTTAEDNDDYAPPAKPLMSLRTAIRLANTTAGFDYIEFNIPAGGGVARIVLKPQPGGGVCLPDILESVMINGYTQPGAMPNTLAVGNNALLKVEIDAGNTVAGYSRGLMILAPYCEVRGLIINNCLEAGIIMSTSYENVIAGNWLGTQADGTTPSAGRKNKAGIWVTRSSRNQIGGPLPGDRNLLSGNWDVGLVIAGPMPSGSPGIPAEENLVLGNYIGTDYSGLAPLPNGRGGILIQGCDNNHIGDGTAAGRNVISGNLEAGVKVVPRLGGLSPTGNSIVGNYIGLAANGDLSATRIKLGNTGSGILISNSVGTVVGAGLATPPTDARANIIIDNGAFGVQVTGDTAKGNCIRGNQIRENGGVSILLGDRVGAGPTDPAHPTAGPNEWQQPPLVVSTRYDAAKLQTAISGRVQSASPKDLLIDLYLMPASSTMSFGEAKTYLDSIRPEADGRFCVTYSGKMGFIPGAPPGTPQTRVTATATSLAGSTSGLSSPPKWDLLALEVIQSVQDWNNSVPLFIGKETWVRAHLQTQDGADALVDLAKLKPRLHGVDGAGIEWVDSPRPPAQAGNFTLPGDAAPARADFGSTLNFPLPSAWCRGGLTLWLEAENLNCAECDSCPACPTCSVTVRFNPAPKFDLVIQPIKYYFKPALGAVTETRDVTPTALGYFTNLLNAMYPIAKAQIEVAPVPLLILDEKTGCFIGNTPECSQINRELYRKIGWFASLGSEKLLGLARGPANTLSGLVGLTPKTLANHISTSYYRFPKAEARAMPLHELGHALGLPHSIIEKYAAKKTVSKPGGGSVEMRVGFFGELNELTDPFFAYHQIPPGAPLEAPTLGDMANGPRTMVYGLDTSRVSDAGPLVIDPTQIFELMCYANHHDLGVWISKQNYEFLAAILGIKYGYAAKRAQAPRSGTKPDYLLVRGDVNLWAGTVQFTSFGQGAGSAIPAEIEFGDYQLQLLDGAGKILYQTSFAPTRYDAPPLPARLGGFVIPVPASPAYREARVLRQGMTLASLKASPNAPTIRLESPIAGENISSSTIPLVWSAQDADRDRLSYDIQYSLDGGKSWMPVQVDWPDTHFELDRSNLPGTTQGMVRVVASDGFHTTVADSPFNLSRLPPRVDIVAPTPGRILSRLDPIHFEASIDARGENPESLGNGTNLVWESSLDGVIGRGPQFVREAATLRPGLHEIRVTATNSAGGVATASVSIQVQAEALAQWADLALETVLSPAVPYSGTNFTLTLIVRNTGAFAATKAWLTNDLPPGLSAASVSASAGTVTNLAKQVIANLGILPPGQSASVILQFTNSSGGWHTNRCLVSAAELDPDPANNTSTEEFCLVEPRPALPDLVVVSSVVPANPGPGESVNYLISVANQGAGPATRVRLTNSLPLNATLLSAAVSQGAWQTSGPELIVEFGAIPAGTNAQAEFRVRPSQPGPLFSQAGAALAEADAEPLDNVATSIVTVVSRLLLRAVRDGAQFRLEWPDAPNLQLEQTTSLGNGAAWAPASGSPVLNQGTWRYPVPADGKTKFYRLRQP